MMQLISTSKHSDTVRTDFQFNIRESNYLRDHNAITLEFTKHQVYHLYRPWLQLIYHLNAYSALEDPIMHFMHTDASDIGGKIFCYDILPDNIGTIYYYYCEY